ncbi:MAG: hypothetical protein M3441_20700 [Chloroflexota bacterium]|nr:hypothetical protein [Chloroflexota bacterium]
MEQELNSFISRVPSLQSLTPTGLIDYFIYFLTVEQGKPGARPADVEACFEAAHMTCPGVSQYLSRKSVRKRGTKPTFIKDAYGYHLERSRRDELDTKLGQETIKKTTSKTLRELLDKVTIDSERDFLREAIECYEIRAYRAAIIMGWMVTLDHLYEFILANTLAAFNLELAKVTDRRVKVSVVRNKDDFGDIPEGKLIEIARSAGIISNDVRKILDVKLGIRNTYAHPSTVTISQVKASDFLQDLVSNVILKYKI